MTILLFQWKTVNDVTNTQKHLQSFCTKEVELRQIKGVFKQTQKLITGCKNQRQN